MTAILKQRLVGAIVLISLGIIFIPMLLTGTDGLTTGELPTNIPPKPLYEIQAPATLPLERKNLPEPVLEPIPEPDSTPVSEKQTVEKPAPVEEKVDVAVIEPVPEVEKKTETVAPAKSESKSTATKPAAKSETTEQKTAVKPASKATTTAKVEIAKQKQPIVSGWVVQLGSFSVEKNAIKLRDKLRKNGHASFVESYVRDNKTSYRVRVGPELTRELANKLKIQLKKETKIDGLVMAFPG
ncbi:MAG: SPOR domain-containing protein [Gammaproteobacteria bacterium]